jgi:hypothetical protein
MKGFFITDHDIEVNPSCVGGTVAAYYLARQWLLCQGAKTLIYNRC